MNTSLITKKGISMNGHKCFPPSDPSPLRLTPLLTLLLSVIALIGGKATNAQVAVRTFDLDVTVNLMKEIDGQIWIGAKEGAYRVNGNTVQRFLYDGFFQGPNVSIIKKIGDYVWLGTDGGACRVAGDDVECIEGFDAVEGMGVSDIEEINGEVWVATDEGAYLITDNFTQRIPDQELNVSDVQYINGEVWLLTSRGLSVEVSSTKSKIVSQSYKNIGPVYRVEEGRASPVINDDVDVSSIKVINGKTWLATNKGAYRVTGHSVRRFPDKELDAGFIHNINGHVWLATNKGVYRVDGDSAKQITEGEMSVTNISYIDGHVWLATKDGVYRVNDDRAQPVIRGLDVWEIKNVNGQILITTYQSGAYRIEGNTVRRVIKENETVTDIKEIEDQIWFSTQRGAYRMVGDTAQKIPGETLGRGISSVKDKDGRVLVATIHGVYSPRGDLIWKDEKAQIWSMKYINGQVWIDTNIGTYLFDNNKAKRILEGSQIYSTEVEVIGGQPWLITNHGVFRIDKEVAIGVVPVSEDSWWSKFLNFVLPNDVLISGVVKPKVFYKNIINGEDPYDKSFPRNFSVILESDKNKYDQAVKSRDYLSVDHFERTLAAGKQTLFISVQDQWGNTFDYTTSVWVMPGPAILPAIVFLFWMLSLTAFLVLAPYNTFSHNLIMNPWLRKYGSFGLVPLTMTAIKPVRSHVLKRYLQNIRMDESFSIWQRRFVLPNDEFLPSRFGKLLQEHRKIFLAGQSGIGKTSYLRYLTEYYASKIKGDKTLKNYIPIFLPLHRYQGAEPEDMVYAQLVNYGRLTDKELVSTFLQQGGFLILADGLNEVDETTRQKISRFIDQHWKANCFCVSSQEVYPEFAGTTIVELAHLPPEKVRELLYRCLEEAKAESIIKQFDAELYEVYKIPQDLEFATELVKNNQPLPKTRRELYEVTLSPLLELWIIRGQPDYPSLLFERAYEMLSSQDVSFERQTKPLPSELRDGLVERKFLVRRSNLYHFRHDLVRAFLASKYFSPRWDTLLQDDELHIDTNWRTMLEFTLLNLADEDAAQSLLNILLVKNKYLAGDLFKWLRHAHPRLCKKWEKEFISRYGKVMLQ